MLGTITERLTNLKWHSMFKTPERLISPYLIYQYWTNFEIYPRKSLETFTQSDNVRSASNEYIIHIIYMCMYVYIYIVETKKHFPINNEIEDRKHMRPQISRMVIRNFS